METQLLGLTPYENFLFSMKAKETKRQYPHPLDKFLTFIGLQGSIQDNCSKLYELAKDINLLQSRLIQFINVQKERIENKEISEGTLLIYNTAIKLFLSMNDVIINWRKISKGIPAERHNAEDRIPTMKFINCYISGFDVYKFTMD